MKCWKCSTARKQDWSFCPSCGVSFGPFTKEVTDHEVDEIYDRMYKGPDSVRRERLHHKGREGLMGAYGGGVRQQVFEVIVRQAMAGAPWREICEGPMRVNSITIKEVEDEVRKRLNGGDDFSGAPVPRNPWKPQDSGNVSLPLPMASQQLEAIREHIVQIADARLPVAVEFAKLAQELDSLLSRVRRLEALAQESRDAQLSADLDREIQRNVIQFKQKYKPSDPRSHPYTEPQADPDSYGGSNDAPEDDP